MNTNLKTGLKIKKKSFNKKLKTNKLINNLFSKGNTQIHIIKIHFAAENSKPQQREQLKS